MLAQRGPFARTPARAPAAPTQSETTSWAAAVVTNGGTVSAGRFTIVNNFVAAEKTAGTWALTDDYWGLWAENAPQALTSLKQRRLGTAVAAPTFTVDRDYAFNGTSSYLNTGFIPSTHAVAMTGTNLRLATYERTNVAANTLVAGAFNGTSQQIRMVPRSASGALQLNLNCQTAAVGVTFTDGRGYTAISRTPGDVYEGFRQGASWGTVVPTSPGTVLTTATLFIGCYSNSGAAAGFRACSVGLVAIGASISAAQEAAQYTNVQAWATAVGAQV